MNVSYSIGELRLRPPVVNDPYDGIHNATTFGAACIQQVNNDKTLAGLEPVAIALLQELFNGTTIADDEDC